MLVPNQMRHHQNQDMICLRSLTPPPHSTKPNPMLPNYATHQSSRYPSMAASQVSEVLGLGEDRIEKEEDKKRKKKEGERRRWKNSRQLIASSLNFKEPYKGPC